MVEHEWEPPRCGVCMAFDHDDETCSKHVVDEPKKQISKNNDGFQHASKKAVCGINMGPKVQYRSIKHVYNPISKKNGASTRSTKKYPETTRQEASTSNPFDALRSVDNDDVLGTNGGSSMGVETVVEEGQKAHAEPVTNEQPSPTLSKVVGSNTGKSKVGDVTNEDSDSEVEEVFDETAGFMASNSGGGTGRKSLYDNYDDNPYDDDECEDLTKEQLAFCDASDIRLCGHARC